MKLKIIYFIHRIYYTGDNVGSDWTFYFKTAAGISKINSSIKAGQTEYKPKVVAVVDGEAYQNLVETWWVSATERDKTDDDQGVSPRYRVPYVVEQGAEHVRTLTLEVTETNSRGGEKRATLSILFGIFIDDPTAPIPAVDATLLPNDTTGGFLLPGKTAGDFPRSFRGTAYGKHPDPVPVVADKVVEIELGDQPKNPRDQILARFLDIFIKEDRPSQFNPKLGLYRIYNREGKTFWSTQNSSAGIKTQVSLIEALNEAVIPEGGRNPRFERLPRQLLYELLKSQFAGDVGEAAQTLADLIMVLTEVRPEQTFLYHDLFIRRNDLGWYSGVWTRAFFVEPTPYAGPDHDLWLVVWTDAWEVEAQLP